MHKPNRRNTVGECFEILFSKLKGTASAVPFYHLLKTCARLKPAAASGGSRRNVGSCKERLRDYASDLEEGVRGLIPGQGYGDRVPITARMFHLPAAL